MAGLNSDRQLTVDELTKLAPLELVNHREDRFRGGEKISVSGG